MSKIPLEKQVVSLELARKLKELGVGQESAFYFEELFTDEKGVLETNFVQSKRYKGESGVRYFSAFTVAELAFDMPKHSFTLYWEEDIWRCGCDVEQLRYRLGLPNGKGYNKELRNFYDTNVANALAMLKIDLLNQKIIKP